jgi:hypothetical protein
VFDLLNPTKNSFRNSNVKPVSETASFSLNCTINVLLFAGIHKPVIKANISMLILINLNYINYKITFGTEKLFSNIEIKIQT